MESDKKDYTKILDLIESFSKGNYDSRIKTQQSNSELEVIAQNLNRLGENLSLSKNELELQRYFIGSVLSNIPADIAVFDDKHNYLFINDQAIGNKNTRDWLIGKNDFDYSKFKGVSDEIAVKRKALFNEAVSSRSDVQWVDEHPGENGTRSILRKFHPVFENDHLKYVIGYGIDITDLKNAEREKNRLIDELNNKYNDLMQFNYIVSHNLRSPVASMIGLTELIKMPDMSQEEKAQTLEHIRACVLRMDELLKDLSILLTGRSSSNNLKENIDLQILIRRIKDTLGVQLIEHNAVVKTEISEDTKTVYTVKSYLESILFNLISNAIKYRSPERNPEVTIASVKNDTNLILTVEDNGIGIDLSIHRKDIFGLFKRFSKEADGIGLGLHMTKAQVTTLGGIISVESEPGKGTKFTIVLPLK